MKTKTLSVLAGMTFILFLSSSAYSEVWVCNNGSVVYGHVWNPNSTIETNEKVTVQINEPFFGADSIIYDSAHVMFGEVKRSKMQIYMNTVKLAPDEYPHRYNVFIINKYTGEGHFQILQELEMRGAVQYIETHYFDSCKNRS